MSRPSRNSVQRELKKFEKEYAKVTSVLYSMSFKMRCLLAARLVFKRFLKKSV